ELLSQMIAQRLDPVTLGGMMAGSVEIDSAFPRDMNGGLGYFPGDEGIDSQRHGFLDVALRRAGAPGDTLDRAAVAIDEQRLAAQRDVQLLGQFRATDRFAQFALQTDGARIGGLQPAGDMPTQ